MDVNVREMAGVWDRGFSLDKHTLESHYIGDNEYGHPQFKTVRSSAGEALFLLKYRRGYEQIPILAKQMAVSLGPRFPGATVVVPMPPSRYRARQPVVELGRQLAAEMKIRCVEGLLAKTGDTPQMKDIALREDKVSALRAAFTINDVLEQGRHDVLVVDDLYDSGASLEAATLALRAYPKVGRIYVATATRTA